MYYIHCQEIGGNGFPTTGLSDEGMSLSAKQHHHPPVGGEYDPFAPPRISIPPYSTGIWDTDVDLVDVRHLVSEAYRQQWDKGNHNDGLCWFMAVFDRSFMSVYDG